MKERYYTSNMITMVIFKQQGYIVKDSDMSVPRVKNQAVILLERHT